MYEKLIDNLRKIDILLGTTRRTNGELRELVSEHSELFDSTYDMFHVFSHDYNCNRCDRYEHYEKTKKYPYGYLGRFHGVESLLGDFHNGYSFFGEDEWMSYNYDWSKMADDVKFCTEWNK